MTLSNLTTMYNLVDYHIKKTTKPIYHYTSPEGVEGIIKNSFLFATDNTYLNDRMEGWQVFNVLKDNLNDYFKNNYSIKNEIENRINELKKRVNDPNWFDSYVVSFSLNRDSLEMWNYYTKGDDNLGYNLEFYTAKLRKNFVICEKENDGNITKYSNIVAKEGYVVYKLEEQKKIIADIIRQIDIDDEKIRSYYIVRKLWEVGRFIKKECFSFEREYRYLFSFIHDQDGVLTPKRDKYRTKKGIMIPYQEAKFKRKALTGVTCSPSLEGERAINGVKRLLLNYDYSVDDNSIIQSNVPIRY